MSKLTIGALQYDELVKSVEEFDRTSRYEEETTLKLASSDPSSIMRLPGPHYILENAYMAQAQRDQMNTPPAVPPAVLARVFGAALQQANYTHDPYTGLDAPEDDWQSEYCPPGMPIVLAEARGLPIEQLNINDPTDGSNGTAQFDREGVGSHAATTATVTGFLPGQGLPGHRLGQQGDPRMAQGPSATPLTASGPRNSMPGTLASSLSGPIQGGGAGPYSHTPDIPMQNTHGTFQVNMPSMGQPNPYLGSQNAVHNHHQPMSFSSGTTTNGGPNYGTHLYGAVGGPMGAQSLHQPLHQPPPLQRTQTANQYS